VLNRVIDMPSKKPLKSLLPFDEYDYVLVYLSGGKDSVACLLHMYDIGIDPEKIILQHHLVDGHPDDEHPLGLYYDWPVTTAYVDQFARDHGLPIIWSWREGGIEAEMMRKDYAPDVLFTQSNWDRAIRIETDRTGRYKAQSRGGKEILPEAREVLQIPESVRINKGMWPAQGSILDGRWCSGQVKIDVAEKVIRHHPDFKQDARILEITGERRAESKARSLYLEMEEGANAPSRRRLVHLWRPVIDWDEERVWDAYRRYGVFPHPAYWFGFGRCSCMTCVFCGPKQWATINALSPTTVDTFAAAEKYLNHTMKKGQTILKTTGEGQKKYGLYGSLPDLDEGIVDEWMSGEFNQSTWTEKGRGWVQPAGAYAGPEGGPS
jgi:3'-phosphoadenosine 5'-phosphosulfate sulfotransferase (PAPS reductase)/FAD synthetase